MKVEEYRESLKAPGQPKKKRKDLEHAMQVSLMKWAEASQQKYPELKWLFSIPNGAVLGAWSGKYTKDEGRKRGVPDLFLLAARRGFHGMFLELKTAGGKPSPEQIEFGADAERQGYFFWVCYSLTDAIARIEWYLTQPD